MTKPTRDSSGIPGPRPGDVPFGAFGGGGAGQSVSIPLIGGTMRTIVVPPGGFAGFAQQTAATQQLFQQAGRKGGKRSAAVRRRKKRKTVKTAKRKTTRRKATKKRLVKGSRAAKAYMAKIRRKRKR